MRYTHKLCDHKKYDENLLQCLSRRTNKRAGPKVGHKEYEWCKRGTFSLNLSSIEVTFSLGKCAQFYYHLRDTAIYKNLFFSGHTSILIFRAGDRPMPPPHTSPPPPLVVCLFIAMYVFKNT